MKSPLKYTEAELTSGLKQGDRLAYEQLYESYSAELYTIALGILRNEALAADALQEVFMKIWQHINKYDPDKGNLLWWTKKIAWNTSLDIIRSKQFSNSRLNEPLSDVHKHLLGDTNQVEFGLRKLTARLKKEHKEVVDLVYFEGYKQEEIAAKLGIPLGTVKSRLRAAMKALRKLI